MPIATAQQAIAPATAPLWYYNETSGLWVQDATHVATRTGVNYVVSLPHFSIANVDVAKVNADCMQVVVDTTKITLPAQVLITVPDGNQNVQFIRELGSDFNPINVVSVSRRGSSSRTRCWTRTRTWSRGALCRRPRVRRRPGWPT